MVCPTRLELSIAQPADTWGRSICKSSKSPILDSIINRQEEGAVVAPLLSSLFALQRRERTRLSASIYHQLGSLGLFAA